MLPVNWKCLLPNPCGFYEMFFDISRGSSNRIVVRCCFHRDNTPSMSVNLQTGRFKCFGCGISGDIIDFYQQLHNLDFKTAVQQLIHADSISPLDKSVVTAKQKHPTVSSELLEKIWNEAKDISDGDPVDKYLKGRKIFLRHYPASLRFHPQLVYKNKNRSNSQYPAMIAKMISSDGAFIGIHRTYLTANSKKMSVRVLGGVGAIRLYEPTKELAIAEGIETALSCHVLDEMPVWSCYSTSGMTRFEPPEHVETIYICVDVDENRAGEKAAESLAIRLSRQGLNVRTVKPPRPELLEGPNWDFNDYLRSQL